MNYFAYFSEIEETFVRRRGRNLLLSPLDWALIESWKQRGVPLFVVLRAVEAVFDQAAERDRLQPRKRPIKSLLYCRDEVEAQYAAWLEAQVGTRIDDQMIKEAAGKIESPANANALGTPNAADNFQRENFGLPQAEILRHLQNLKSRFESENLKLNGSWQNLSRRVLIRLKEAESEFLASNDVEQLESRLSEFDCKIDDVLNKIFAPEKLAEIEKQTAVQLRSVKRQMPSQVFEQTYNALLVKNLREAADLPRFSLFYL